MSIFACIYGFFHCSCTENSVHAPFAWQWTHAWSNVCYLKPPHLVTHRIRNEIKKKKKGMWDAGMVHGFGFAQEIPPVICVRLSKCRDRLWQFYTAPDGKQSFPPSHWLQAWHSIETFTQVHTNTHTRIHEHFHPIGTTLANQYARKPQGLVSHCFQTRPNSSYRKMYCTTGG